MSNAIRYRLNTPRGSLLLATALVLSGCAVLPTSETAAFKTISLASQTSFASLAQAESDAIKADKLAKVASRQDRLLLTSDCVAEETSEAPCLLVVGDHAITRTDQGLPIVLRAKQVSSVIAALGDYGAAMSDLAVATDLATADAAATKAAFSLKALLALVPSVGPVAGAVVDGLVFARSEFAKAQRRRLLLRLSDTAQPIVDGAVKLLHREADQLRATLINLREGELLTAMEALNQDDRTPHPSPIATRQKLITAVVSAVDDLNAARAIKTDFQPLSAANEGVRASLRHSDTDPTASLRSANAFVATLQSLAAIKPAAAAT